MEGSTIQLLKNKTEQLRTIGLSFEEEFFLTDILSTAVSAAAMEGRENLPDYNQFSNSSYLYNLYNPFCAVSYPLNWNANSSLIGINSHNMDPNNFSSDYEHAGSSSTNSKSVLPNSINELKFVSKSKEISISAKIEILRNVMEGVQDHNEVLITAKPKNKSQKIRKSNRHSHFRGVSLNGKKWQVMIMGSKGKKYFGGILVERDAAIFYDKLSILTNGLAAKTNFSYRKSDLESMIGEFQMMEPYISN